MAVPGMDDPEKLLEYFFIHELPVTDAPPAPAETPVQGAWVVQTRWRNALGFQYRGRLDYTGRRNFIGLRLEQDEGETWRWVPGRNIWGVDHFSFTYQHRLYGLLRTLTLGEFGIHAGMGLVFNAGFFLGKGSAAPLPSATAYVRSGPSFRENNIQSGISAVFKKNHWKVISAVSRSANDANIYKDDTFRSLSNPGIHVTVRDRDKHNRVADTGIHVVTQYAGKHGYFGSAVNISMFSHRFRTSADYQNDLPSGRTFGQASFFGFLRWGRSAIWGEFAISDIKATAAIAGVSRTFGRHSSLVMSIRRYSPRYLTFWGKSLSESSNGHRNETGIYTAFIAERRKRYRLFSFLDLYRIPAESYRHEAGLTGAEFRTSYTYWIHRKNEIRWTSRMEWRSQEPGNPLNALVTHKQQFLMYTALPIGRLAVRLQYNGRISRRYEDGFLAALEQRFDVGNMSFSLFAALFKTSSYYTREFVYERDVWGSFSLPSYFNKGLRTMIFYRWRYENTTLWIRAGLTQTAGKPVKGEVKLQVKYQI